MVFVRGEGQKDNESFFKVTPLIWAIEDQYKKSYKGGGGWITTFFEVNLFTCFD